jgi:hypothetical protein
MKGHKYSVEEQTDFTFFQYKNEGLILLGVLILIFVFVYRKKAKKTDK